MAHFTKICEEWSHSSLTLEHRFILAVVKQFNDNQRLFYMTAEDFCDKYKLSLRTYRRRFKELVEWNLLVQVATHAQNRKSYKYDETELEFFFKRMANMATKNGHGGQAVWPLGPGTMATVASENGHGGLTQVTNKNKKENIKGNRQGNKLENSIDKVSIDLFLQQLDI